MTEKIRPRVHSTQDPSVNNQRIRQEAEGGLPDRVRAPDIGATSAGVDGSVDATAVPGEEYKEPTQWPARPPGAKFDPNEAVELRRTQNDPNRLGKPRLSKAEELLKEYQEAEREMKRIYQATRDESGRERYLKAKAAMIEAGLMKGDV